MKKIFFFVLAVAFLMAGRSSAQICDPTTPVFNVNLTGNPFGTWTSPSGPRQGFCCSAVSPDKCVEFIITLDPTATGISFDIASGAIPPGALFYQVNCGPPIQVGQPICLTGAGPHYLTFCKPGNNPNSYTITSLAQPPVIAMVSSIASPQCPAQLTVQGLAPSTITWTSMPPNAAYNSYLSCVTGCDTPTITPSGIFPPYVDYVVCGNSGTACTFSSVCDTVRAYLIQDVTVSLSPSNITLCNGVSTVPVSATASGGSGSYQYVWSSGQTTSNIVAGAGSYTVSVSDTAVCSVATATSVIIVLPPILVNAGNDVTVCADQPNVNLNGTLQTATAGLWSGGSGTFNPNNAALNAVYTPSPAEIANGSVDLILTSTANQGCPAGYDTIHITIIPLPSPFITGANTLCAGSTVDYSAQLVPGCLYSWSVNGGTINGSSASNSINVSWGNSNAGTVTLVQTNSYGCSITTTLNISLVVLPNPVIAGSNSFCQYASSTYSIICLPGSTYSWSAVGGNIVGSDSNSTVHVNWTNDGNGSVTILETNSFGCSQTFTMPVTVYQKPAPSISGVSTLCAGSETFTYASPLYSNMNYQWSVNGGSIMSSNGMDSIYVSWNSNGTNSVSLTISDPLSGCDSSVVLPVVVGALSPVSVQATAMNGCPPLSVTFSGNNPLPAQTYAWSFGDQWYSASANPTHVYEEPGTYHLNVVTQHPGGCIDSASVTIHVYDVPHASFNHNFENITYMLGDSIPLELTNTTTGGVFYLWTFGLGDTANVFEPHINYQVPGEYTIQLVAFGPTGCPDTAEKEIRVRNKEFIHVPTAFTPNGDQTNDYFYILTTNIHSASVGIFNRWGEFFYTSDDKNFRWDGTVDGTPVELGVYGYRITAVGETGKRYTLLGTVTVVR